MIKKGVDTGEEKAISKICNRIGKAVGKYYSFPAISTKWSHENIVIKVSLKRDLRIKRKEK